MAKKQNDEVATFAPKIKNEDVEIFLSDTKEKALSKIKAFNDQPGAFIIFNNKTHISSFVYIYFFTLNIIIYYKKNKTLYYSFKII